MRILVIGASGFLGKKLCSTLKGEIFPSSRKTGLDICDPSSIKRFLQEKKPETVVLAASYTDVDGCEKDRQRAYDVNVTGTKNVVDACLERGLRLVFFSTDYIFDGERGNYCEEDEPNPQSHYAKTKLLAEEAIKESGVDSLIERVSVLYGHNDSQDKQTFEKWVMKNLKENMAINVVCDQFSCPTLIDDIADATNTLLEKNEEGLFHVVGSECLSRFDFALNIADCFGLDGTLLRPIRSEELNQLARRPKNSCLATEKIKRLEIRMSDTKTGLKTMRRSMCKPLNICPENHSSKVP